MRQDTRAAAVAAMAFLLSLTGCMSAPTATPTVTPGGRPSVVIESPPDGATYSVGGTVDVHAHAQDRLGVNRIELSTGGVLVASRTTAGAVPLESFSTVLEWRPTAEGEVELSVVAYRLDGTASVPATITVSVVFAGSPPTTSPSGLAVPDLGPSPSTTPMLVAGGTPTAAPRPTLPPFATPSPESEPTRRPTPPPTEPPTPTPEPTPTELNLLVTVDRRDLRGRWEVGTVHVVRVVVTNLGTTQAPPVRVRARLCPDGGRCGDGGSASARTVELGPEGGNQTLGLDLTPLVPGDNVLRINVVIPRRFVDEDETDLVQSFPIVVRPGQATPPPTGSPTP